jgi:hypothetical protein
MMPPVIVNDNVLYHSLSEAAHKHNRIQVKATNRRLTGELPNVNDTIRAPGRRRPHSRHYEALPESVGITEQISSGPTNAGIG